MGNDFSFVESDLAGAGTDVTRESETPRSTLAPHGQIVVGEFAATGLVRA
jgi:hypothetical protein